MYFHWLQSFLAANFQSYYQCGSKLNLHTIYTDKPAIYCACLSIFVKHAKREIPVAYTSVINCTAA